MFEGRAGLPASLSSGGPFAPSRPRPLLTGHQQRHRGLSLKHLLTNSFSLSLDFLHFHVDNSRCCKLTDDGFDSFRLFCFDGNGATQREISGRPPHFFRRLSRNLADKLRQRSQTAQQPALPRPKRKSQNTSGLAQKFSSGKSSFFGKRGGPKECDGLGSLWVCSSTGLAGGLTLDLERTQQQVGGRRRRRRRRVGPRRKPGARESSRRPSRQLRPPGLSQGQALLLDFTMI